MSREFKELKIAGKNITVYELTVKDIKKLWRDMIGANPGSSDVPMFSNEALLKSHWDKCIHGIALEEADDLVPSELKMIYDAFAEVNAIFFDLVLRLEGENPLLKGLRETILNDLMLRFAAYSQEDTKESGSTDTASS